MNGPGILPNQSSSTTTVHICFANPDSSHLSPNQSSSTSYNSTFMLRQPRYLAPVPGVLEGSELSPCEAGSRT